MARIDDMDDDFLNGQLGLPQGANYTPFVQNAPQPPVDPTLGLSPTPDDGNDATRQLDGSNGISTPSSQSALPADPVKAAIAKKYGFSAAADEGAMQDAQQVANNNRLFANLGAALNTTTNAIAGRQAPADNSSFDKMGAESDTMAKGVKDLRQGELDNQKLSKQQALEDAQSPQSKALQNNLKRLYPNQFSDEDLANISASDMDLVFKPLQLKEQIEQRKQASRDSRDLKQLLYSNKLSELDSKHDTEALKQLQTNKGYMAVKDHVDSAPGIEDMIQSATRNPAAYNALATEMGLFISRGQRLHTSTIEAMQGGSQAFNSKLGQMMQKGRTGTLTPENAAALTAYVRQEAQSAEQAKSKLETEAAKNFQAIHKKAPSWYTPSEGRNQASQSPQGSGAEDEMRRRGLLK